LIGCAIGLFMVVVAVVVVVGVVNGVVVIVLVVLVVGQYTRPCLRSCVYVRVCQMNTSLHSHRHMAQSRTGDPGQ